MSTPRRPAPRSRPAPITATGGCVSCVLTGQGYCGQGADGEGRDRTGDTTVFSRVLYQLRYLAAVA